MMRKRKVITSIVLFLGLVSITASAFSAYVISNSQNEIINVDHEDIEVKDLTQKVLSFLNIYKKIGFRDEDIVDDVFSVNMSFDNSVYVNPRMDPDLKEMYENSALKIVVSFDNSNLFQHISNNLYSFINFSYQLGNSGQADDYYLNEGKLFNTKYYYGIDNEIKDCITTNANQLEFYIPLSEERCASIDDTGSKNFYLFKISSDNKISNLITRNFLVNFNFNIIDSKLGYSIDYMANSIGGINIKLSFVDLRV